MDPNDFFRNVTNGTLPNQLDLNAGSAPMGGFGREFAMNSPAPQPMAESPMPAPGLSPAIRPKPKVASMAAVPSSPAPMDDVPKAADAEEDDSPDLSASQYQVTPEQLADARDEKRRIALINGASEALGNAQGWGNFFLGRMNPHNDYNKLTKDEQAEVDQPIKDKQLLYKQAFQNQQDKLQMAQSKAAQEDLARFQDPESMDSKFGKVLLGRLNGEHNFGLSQDDIKGMNARQVGQFLSQPGVSDIIAGDKAARAFQQQMAIKDKELAAAQARFDAGQGNKDNKDWEGLSNRINDPSSRSQIGRFEQNIQKANALKVLERSLGMPENQMAPANETREQKIARYNRASPQQLYEIAKAADQLVSNAGSTVYGTEHMMPQDMGIASAKFKQWLKGGPVGANSGEFIDNFMHLADRESGYYNDAKNKAIERLGAGYSHLKNKDPKRWNDVLGLSPQAAQPQQQAAPQYDQDVLDYAKKHNLTPDQAQQVKIQRTQVVGR